MKLLAEAGVCGLDQLIVGSDKTDKKTSIFFLYLELTENNAGYIRHWPA